MGGYFCWCEQCNREWICICVRARVLSYSYFLSSARLKEQENTDNGLEFILLIRGLSKSMRCPSFMVFICHQLLLVLDYLSKVLVSVGWLHCWHCSLIQMTHKWQARNCHEWEEEPQMHTLSSHSSNTLLCPDRQKVQECLAISNSVSSPPPLFLFFCQFLVISVTSYLFVMFYWMKNANIPHPPPTPGKI